MKTNNRQRKEKCISLGIMLFFTVLLVIIDQVTKIFAKINLSGNRTVSLIPKIVHLNYLENRGAAFGILQDSRLFFLIITVLVAVISIFIIWKLLEERKFNLLVINLVLFLAGAIGNFVDRLSRHYVIDFFEFEFIRFPVFNVADIYVTISFILFLILLFFVYKENDFDGVFSWKNKTEKNKKEKK